MIKDLSIFIEDLPFFRHSLVPEKESAALISGPQKTAQKFLIRLMTSPGSMRYQLTEGSVFGYNVLHGLMANESDIRSTFAMSVLQIRSSESLEETEDTPDEERFEDASIDDMVLETGVLMTTITVITRAGGEATVKVPIRFQF